MLKSWTFALLGSIELSMVIVRNVESIFFTNIQLIIVGFVFKFIVMNKILQDSKTLTKFGDRDDETENL